MAAILTPRVVRRMAGECTDVDERGAVGIRLEPAAAIDENQDGTRGSNRSSGESVNHRFLSGGAHVAHARALR